MLITTEEFECNVMIAATLCQKIVLGKIEDKVLRKSFTADNDVKRVWDWN